METGVNKIDLNKHLQNVNYNFVLHNKLQEKLKILSKYNQYKVDNIINPIVL